MQVANLVYDWISNRLIPGGFRSFPGRGIDRILNGWKLSGVMAKTARGGLPWVLRAAWPLIIPRVAFVRSLIKQADDGRPVRESKFRLFGEFLAHLGAGPFLGGRNAPSLPDLSAYPQFVLYYAMDFRGGQDILEQPELMNWLGRMRSYLTGEPQLVPENVCRRELP